MKYQIIYDELKEGGITWKDLDISWLISSVARSMHNTRHDKALNKAREQMALLTILKEQGNELEG